ncbi:anti-sigma factor [Geodermatophilus sp. URMC 62]|uniref:anti-sigma factor n=1 Tax=Geodermatophilus sp. URMC 62 TaxID=3423414 RepID=UPI00406C448D
MPHCTPEELALAALGEPLAADDAAHLAGCARCREEVARLRRPVLALALPELADPGPPVAPPPGLWAGIAAATGVGAAPRPDVVAASAPPAGPVPDVPPVPVLGPAAGVPGPTPAPVVPLRPRRNRVVLAAAASLVTGLVIGAGVVAVRDRDPAQPADTGVPVAAATLDPLEGSGASGRAAVLERPDGTRVLRVELDADAPREGYLEAWLLTESVSGLIPLGVARPGIEEFELPPEVDIGEYPVVDVSVEQLDGDPTHSGDSVARGQLDT